MPLIHSGLAVSIAIPVLGGLFISQLTQESIVTWFKTLRKPFWQPPPAIFGPVWTVLYALQGVASYEVYQLGGFNGWALKLYATQLGINFLWPLVFFNVRSLFLSVLVNIALFVSAWATQGAFYKLAPEAGQLMVPYIVWLAFANLLNIRIWRMNRHSKEVTTTGAPGTMSDKEVEVTKHGKGDFGPIGPADKPSPGGATACLRATRRAPGRRPSQPAPPAWMRAGRGLGGVRARVQTPLRVPFLAASGARAPMCRAVH